MNAPWRTYEPVDPTAMPDVAAVLDGLDGLGGDVVAGAAAVDRVVEVRFDTADRRLRAAGAAVARVEGGDQEGWHAELAGWDGDPTLRRSVSLSRSRNVVPAQLRRLFWTIAAEVPLEPVVRVERDRSSYPLGRAQHATSVHLTVERLGVSRPARDGSWSLTSWVEMRLDSSDADEKLLRALDKRLRSLGLRRRSGPSGTEDAAGAAHPAGIAAAPTPRFKPKTAVGDVVGDYLARQIAVIVSSDPLVRFDAPGAVHRMRVASRRLRSGLRAYRDLYEPQSVDLLDGELRWLAQQLGLARDAEVLRERLLDVSADDTFTARARRTLADQLERSYRVAHVELGRALDSERYRVLVDSLRHFAEQRGADTPPATKRVDRVAARIVRKADRRLRRTMKAGIALPAGPERDEVLHTARKRAKRARYAAEAVVPALGASARAFSAAMRDLQKDLGDRQDAVAASSKLVELAQAQQRVDVAFLFGRLQAREAQRLAAVDELLEESWRAASAKSLRAWLR